MFECQGTITIQCEWYSEASFCQESNHEQPVDQKRHVVTATDHYRADVLIEDEKVSAIAPALDESADRTIDAEGCYLFPGGIDAHTHMELPFMGTYASDTFHSGTLAGLHGGTTTIVDFAIQTQGDSLESAIGEWHRKADGHAVGDYAFHCAVTDFNEKTRQGNSACNQRARHQFLQDVHGLQGCTDGR